jgi:hypothetical protein
VLEIGFGVPQILGKNHEALDLVLIAFAAYIAGQLVATPAKAVLEDVFARRILGAPAKLLMLPKKERPWYWFLVPGYCAPLAPSLQEEVRERAKKEGLTDLTAENLFQHVRYRPYILADAGLMSRLQVFLIRYGFARNLSFVALVFAAVAWWRADSSTTAELARYASVALLSGVLLLYRYLKFYRLYTFELLATYAGGKS